MSNRFVIDGDIARLQLNTGETCVVDTVDVELLCQYSWWAHKTARGIRGVIGARRSADHIRCYMHRLLMSTPVGIEVRHLNGDVFDNQRINLQPGNAPGARKYRTEIRPIEIVDNLGLVPLGRGKVAKIDLCDIESVGAYNWSLSANKYAVAWLGDSAVAGDKRVLLHRFILKASDDIEIDHINRDGLDNRRVNLRFASRQQNQCNVGLPRNNSTGFKGVSWDRKRNKWHVQIHKDKKGHHLGYFDDQIAAACAYNVAAKKMFGEFAHLNRMD